MATSQKRSITATACAAPRFPATTRGISTAMTCVSSRWPSRTGPWGVRPLPMGEQREYHDPQTYLVAIRQELPYRDVTGFRYETLTDDPAVRKQVDDILFDLYGEENPHSLADYENNPGQNMNMGGM